MPYIPGLSRAIWVNSSTEQRISALNELQTYMANQDGRQPCPVNSAAFGANTRGAHGFSEDGNEYIVLNTNLVESAEPYQAVETLFHEDRHSHQHHVVQKPSLAENQQQLNDWKMSNDGGYIQPGELNYSTYRMQPTEIDANNAARINTDTFYQDTLQDTEGYPGFKAQKELEMADNIAYARSELGEDYEEEVRKAVQAKYQAKQEMGQETSNGLDDSQFRQGYSFDQNMEKQATVREQKSNSSNSPIENQSSSLSNSDFNRIRDDDIEYYEALGSHAAQMDKIGNPEMAGLDREEMKNVSSRLWDLNQEKKSVLSAENNVQEGRTPVTTGEGVASQPIKALEGEQNTGTQDKEATSSVVNQQPSEESETTNFPEAEDVNLETSSPIDIPELTEEGLDAKTVAEGAVSPETVAVDIATQKAESSLGQEELSGSDMTALDKESSQLSDEDRSQDEDQPHEGSSQNNPDEPLPEEPSEEEEYRYGYGW